VARAELAGPRFEPWREGVGALERRRHTGPVSPPSAAESERLDGLATMVAHENAALPELYAGGARKNPATTAVCLVLLAVYLVEEWLGGSENLEVAVAMGAIYSGPGVKPELWRLFAANFLHFGWLHLAMNVGAFFALGPFVERRLGAVRYLLVLLASGLGSMALTTYVFYAGREVVLVGASGAIMGLVGATAAVLLRLRDGDRSGLVGKRLRSIVFILALQFSFDLLTPRVSFAAHASGVLCGFAAALLIDATRREKRQ
jgi:rhomboid protease GluP